MNGLLLVSSPIQEKYIQMKTNQSENNKRPGVFSNKHFRNKLIVIITGILLFYTALYINSKNGFIKDLLGNKTIEIETGSGK